MNRDEIKVVDVDHVVLNVADVERSLAFYCGELDLAPVRVDEWRRGEAPFPSARVTAATIIDLFATARTGVNADHLCLVVEPMDLDALAASGRFTVVDGPGRRFGARGEGTSLYVLDPDGNTVELRYYD
jgi:catechol 2,3-dioxygenase-like lactoylglutathione lyase family enzyme